MGKDHLKDQKTDQLADNLILDTVTRFTSRLIALVTVVMVIVMSIPLSMLGWGWYYCPEFLKKKIQKGLTFFLLKKKWRKTVIQDNLKIAYPGKDNQWLRDRLFMQAYVHMGKLITELFYLFGPLRKYTQNNVTVVGLENWKKAHAIGRGTFIVSSHLGNWEIMAAAGALSGMNPLIVTKKLKPAWLHTIIEKSRARCGVKGTYEPKTMREIMKHLKRGGCVGFILDQYAGPPIGVRVPFFGVPVGTANVLATLVRRTGAQVIPSVIYRLPDGHWKLELKPALTWKKDPNPYREIAINTAHYVTMIEKDIREHPEQWLWSHRRFKGKLSPIEPGEWDKPRYRESLF